MNEHRPESVVCAECQSPMVGVRTDFSAIALLFRYECVRCDATGTVEVRSDDSVAKEKGTGLHGAVSEVRR